MFVDTLLEGSCELENFPMLAECHFLLSLNCSIETGKNSNPKEPHQENTAGTGGLPVSIFYVSARAALQNDVLRCRGRK